MKATETIIEGWGGNGVEGWSGLEIGDGSGGCVEGFGGLR